MNSIIPRIDKKKVLKLLKIFPAVTILGSRQCGKSTLIRSMSNEIPDFLYLDLENRSDRAKLQEPELFFEYNSSKTICIDEIQTMPELFTILRSVIDNDRKPGRFILLGSASREIIQRSSDSLAGRVGLIELTPFTNCEVETAKDYSLFRYWFRGGYPDSYLAADDESSAIWRENYIRTYTERDIPQLGFNIASPRMMRLLILMAHEHGAILNLAKLASAMDMSAPTIRSYIDILEQTYVARILPPFHKNLKKRLVKTPKIYLRDSGILHQLLGLKDYNALLSHTVIGESWEGMVIENVCTLAKNAHCSFYRSATGSEEMDLVLEYPDKTVAVECKSSSAPKVTEGFWKAMATINATEAYIVAPVTEGYKIRDNVSVVNLSEICNILITK